MVKFTAEEGKVYTNGETYGKEIFLPDSADVTAWKQIDESLVPKDGGVMKYSVRSIIREVRALGKYDQFRAFLESAKFDWDFVGANYLAASDPDFVRICDGLVAANIISREELDALLPKCIWTEG